MRYRFRGLLRDTGKPVEGHVEAPSVDQAYALMGDNGIVCESLREDPRMGDFTSPSPNPSAGTGGGESGDEFTDAIDSALDTSSTQVNVDDLWRKYRGQRVRVIDRDKIRNRVMTVVSKAMVGAGGGSEGGAGENQTLERVEEALTKMFGDNQNLTSEVNPGLSGSVNEQIGQLADMMLDLQKSMAEVKALVRKGGGGGWGGGGGGGRGGGHRGAMIKSVKDPKNDKVLLEIFETNIKLQQSVSKKAKGPSEAAKRIAAQTAAKKAASSPPAPKT
ncbi:MAG: hypothetical protein V3V20_03910 [Algisphaera sp.]